MEGNSGNKKRQTKELRCGCVWEPRNEEWFGVYGVGGDTVMRLERPVWTS